MTGLTDLFSVARSPNVQATEGTAAAGQRARAGQDWRAAGRVARQGARQGAGPEVDGKFLRVDGERFYVRGVTYGTFAQSEKHGLFPRPEQAKKDFAAMAAAGINAVT